MSKNKLGQHVNAVEYAIQIVSQVQGVTPLAIENLKEVRDFLNVMNDLLVVAPAVQEGGGIGVFQNQVPQAPAQFAGVPMTQVQGYVPPAPAPAAVQISSGITPTVTGCVAAQPAGLQQTAAQQQLNGLLAEKKKQADLTANLQAQFQAAQVASTVEQTVTVPVPQATAMTLEQFKTQHGLVGAVEQALPVLPIQQTQSVAPALPQLPIQPTAPVAGVPFMPMGSVPAPAEGSPQQRLQEMLEQKKAEQEQAVAPLPAVPQVQIQSAGPAPQAEAPIQSLSDAVEASQGPANTEE